METDIRKQQHIVPKFYLEKFCDSRGLVSVYDITGHRFFCASPDNICKEKNVYETVWRNANPTFGEYVLRNSIEKAFSEKEAEYKDLLDSIIMRCQEPENRNSLICSKKEKNLLADFVTNLHLRNPYVFEYILQKDYPIEELRKIDLYSQTSSLFELMGWGCPDSLILHSVKTGLFDPAIDRSPAHVTVNQLLNMHPVFFAVQNYSFITSSRPVAWIFLRAEDDNTIANAVFIPLTPKLMLMYTDVEYYRRQRNRVSALSDEMVKTFNQQFIIPKYVPVRFLIAQKKSDYDILDLKNTCTQDA